MLEPKHSIKYFRSRYSPIGLDIGHARIKMVQLKRTNNDLYLHRKAIFPTPAGSVTGGNIADPDSLVRHIKSVNEKIGWHGRQVNLCLSSQTCKTQFLRMPLMSKPDLKRAINLEAERLFQLKTDQAVVSHTLVNSNNHNGMKCGEHLLAAVPKEVVTAYMSLAVKSGLTPLSLGIKPLLLQQTVLYARNAGFSESQSPLILIDFGSESTLILVTGSNGYIFHQNINIGLEHFIEKIKSIEALNLISARKRTFSGGSLDQKGLLDLADKLSDTVARNLDYYFERYNSSEMATPRALYVCGGCIFIPGLAAHLQNRLRMKLVLFNPFRYIKENCNSGSTVSDNEGALFSLAQGLALQGWFV